MNDQAFRSPPAHRLQLSSMTMPSIGTMIWVLTAAAARTHVLAVGLIEVLLLFGPLVVVAIGLTLPWPGAATGGRQVDRNGTCVPLMGSGSIPPFAVLAAAALLPIALALPGGVASTVLTIPWLAVTAGLAAAAARRVWMERYPADPHTATAGRPDPTRWGPEAVAAIALAWLPAAALGITASRASLTAFSIPAELIELAGVHFTFAGFAATAIAAQALAATSVTRVAHPHQQRIAILATIATIGGCATVGIGHATARVVELLGASAMTIGVILLGVVAWLVSKDRTVSRRTRVLLRVSALSVLGSMGFALAYAWALTIGADHLPYETIALVHGSLNAFGFALCGLLGWRSFTTTTPSAEATPATGSGAGRPTADIETRRQGVAVPTTP